jgi:type I restriction enzyme M protein
MSIRKPSWFSSETIMVSTAPTCGLTKGGRLLPIVDPTTGKRVQEIDPETGAAVDAIDDRMKDDAIALSKGQQTDTLTFIPTADIDLRCAVPVYYDHRFRDQFNEAMKQPQFSGFETASIGALINQNVLTVRNGHGSPSQDERIGDVPYIKVSDLRAGLVNINPTNRIPLSVAKKFWRGPDSGLKAFDLLCPERTSKNIGDFCILLPGQERVVTTKEVIVLRPGPKANFDPFYLLWALSLKVVRDQWRRIIFMQTNREDVGKRYLEILLPVPPSRERAKEISESFRTYYQTLAKARSALSDYLNQEKQHHFFVSGAEEVSPVDDEDAEIQ